MYSNSRRQAEDYYAEYMRQKELQALRDKQQQYGLGSYYNNGMDLYNRTKGTYDAVTGFGNKLQGYGSNLSNLGSKLSQSQRPSIANLGNRMQTAGGKLQGWGTNLDTAKTNGVNNIANKFQDFISKYRTSANTGASPVSTGAFGSTAQGMAGNLGVGGTQAGGGMLGNAIAGQTAGAGAGAGSSGGMLGSAIAGQTAGTGATAAGSGGALAGSIGSATGGTAAATGASAGGIAAGSGASAGAAGAGAAGGAMGAAGGAAAAIPVAGWIIAAAAAAKMIKDKIDAAHKKVNAKAMQADAENMQKSISANQEVSQTAQNDLQQQAMEDTAALGAPAEAQQQGYAGQLPDISAYQSSDELSDNMIDQLEMSKEPQVSPEGAITGGAAPISNKIQINDRLGIKSNVPINTPAIAQPVQQTPQIPLTQQEGPAPLTGSVVNGMNVYNNLPYEDLPTDSGNVATLQAPAGQNTSGGAAPIKGSVSKNNLVESIKNGIDAFKAGYDENRNTGLKASNLTAKDYTVNTPQTVYKPSDELVNYQNELKNQGLADEIIQGVAQGRNSGNKDIANWIANNPDALKPKAKTINVPTTQRKGAMNRLGEALGTGGRVLSHPATQALLAGLAYGISDGDVWTGIKGGIEYGQNKAKSDYYYKKLTGKNTAPIFNNFGSADYNAEVNQQYKDAMLANTLEKMQQQKANADRTYELNKEKFEEQKNQNNIKNGIAQQRIANQKANADRNYNLKVQKANAKTNTKTSASNNVKPLNVTERKYIREWAEKNGSKASMADLTEAYRRGLI